MYEERMNALNIFIKKKQEAEEKAAKLKEQEALKKWKEVQNKLKSVTERVEGLIALADTCRKADIQIPNFTWYLNDNIFGKWEFTQDSYGNSFLEFNECGNMTLKLPYKDGQSNPFHSPTTIYPITGERFAEYFYDQFPAFEKDFLDWFDDFTGFKGA